MLLGEFTHTIDEKGRVSLPSKFRKELGGKVVVTHGLDNCLFIYSSKEWEKFSSELAKLSFTSSDNRKFTRFLLGGAVETEIDSAGRILIPEFLRSFAKLGTGQGKTIIAGVHNRAEVWNEDGWKKYKASVEASVDTLAERLSDLGLTL